MAKKDKASKLLTEHLSKILKEKCSVPIDVNGKQVIVTKGEALARQMVASALGYEEAIQVYDKDGIPSGTTTVIHSPDQKLIKEILDRVEGKPATTGVKEESNKPTVADRVTELGKSQLNAIAKKSSLKIK